MTAIPLDHRYRYRENIAADRPNGDVCPTLRWATDQFLDGTNGNIQNPTWDNALGLFEARKKRAQTRDDVGAALTAPDTKLGPGARRALEMFHADTNPTRGGIDSPRWDRALETYRDRLEEAQTAARSNPDPDQIQPLEIALESARANGDKIDIVVADARLRHAQDKLKAAPEDAIVREIYSGGLFPEYCRRTFQKIWCGDLFVLYAMLLQTANTFVGNTACGIHLCITGNTQDGKSGSVATAAKLLPHRFVFDSTFSKMALFHADEDLHPGMTILADDKSVGNEEAEIYRTILTHWATGVARKTQIEKGAWKTISTPHRLNMILTTADTVAKVSDENQDESRFLILEIRRTEYDRHKIRVAMQGTPPDIAEDLKVIESVWTVMPKCVINATNNAVTGNTVAFHRLFDAEIPLRDFQRYLAMIRASALLHGRTTTTDDDVVFVANVLSYARHSINSTTAGLTPIERAVQQTLQKEAHVYPVSISQIQGFTNLPVYTVYRALRGKDGSFEHPVGGLLTKDPNVQIGRDLQTHERLIMYGRDGD